MNKNEAMQLTVGDLGKIFPKYLFPSLSAMLFISISYFVDAVCVGQKLGETGLAALNIGVPVTGFLYALGYLLGHGGSTIFSAYIGKEKEFEAKQIYTITAITMLCASVMIAVSGIIFAEQIANFLGASGATRQGVIDYLRYVFIFTPGYIGEAYYSVFVRNDKSPRISMMATFIGCVLNIILDICFVIILDMGMLGASLATGLSVMVSLTLLLLSRD